MPLTGKREGDFYIPDIRRAGCDVEYWDITDLYFQNIDFIGEVSRDYVKKIRSHDELETLITIQENDRCAYVVMISLGHDTIELYRKLTIHRCKLFFFARGLLPTSSYRPFTFWGTMERLLRRLRHRHDILSYLRTKSIFVYKRLGLIKDYDVVFAAGTVAFQMYGKNSRIIPINYFDHDNYLSQKSNGSRLIHEKYCVFLDDNVVYDTDFSMYNDKPISPGQYYGLLNRFFSHIEEKFNIRVVVAAHPKSKYKGHEFDTREVIWDKTNELVKDSQFTITHFSSSIAYAVLYRKPIFFIYTPEMKNKKYFQIIKNMSDCLGADMLNIKHQQGRKEECEINIRPVDEEKYNKYRYDYLTSKETEHVPSKDIVLDFICK